MEENKEFYAQYYGKVSLRSAARVGLSREELAVGQGEGWGGGWVTEGLEYLEAGLSEVDQEESADGADHDPRMERGRLERAQ